VTPCWSAQGPTPSGSEAVFLIQIVILILVGRLLGEAMLRIGQPAVMGQLLAGALLGPSVLGALWPAAQQALFPPTPEQKNMIDGVSQLGILMLLLLAGMETELALVRKVRRAAISASAAGIAIPFVCGFTLGQYLPDELLPDPGKRLITSLFLGTALSIASVKIVATVVREMGFLRRNIGQVILASAIVDDTIGWIIIAITLSLAKEGLLDWPSLAKSVVGTAVFLVVSFTIGRRLVFKLIQWTNDNFVSEAPVLAAILVVMGGFALTTHLIGVHTVLGAFVAGILVGESPILTRQIDEQLRGVIAGLFMPVFFGLAGLHSDLTILSNPELLLLTLGLIAIASFGKAAGAYLGGALGGLTRKECTALATGMNARGSTEVIVATIGLSMGLVSQDLFTMIVTMALVTTFAMPPSLRWALRRLPMREEERKRLDREAFEKHGFVPNLERVLLVVDDSAKGIFASRIAGLIAGRRGTPVTVLTLNDADNAPSLAMLAATEPAEQVETVVNTAEKTQPKEALDSSIDVMERKPETSPEAAIAAEARKGYDMLVIGVDPITGPKGGFHQQVSKLVHEFDGAIAIISARGQHEEEPRKSPLKVLAPITGTEVSRAGAEVALAIAHAAKAPITALSVARASSRSERRRLAAARRDAREVVKQIETLAAFYGKRIETKVRTEASPEDAILREARLGRHNLIVLGVSRRPGETLSFGNLAAALLESSEKSLIFVAPAGVRSTSTPGGKE
jgi:Kef-type K+ transport system membrane component KefB/nucleotide-binding universal stress UspA family protein